MSRTESRYRFRLYVTGNGGNSTLATANLTRLCATHLENRHEIEIVDLSREPERALTDQIFLTPTLIKLAPEPRVHLFGTLSDLQQLLSVLGLPLPDESE